MATAAAPPFSDCLPPRYRIDRVLSQGERGATLEVFDSSLRQTKAAVKVQHIADEHTAPEIEGQFRTFCAALASIRHDLIAVPYTFGTFSSAGETFGYTTRAFVSGTPLSSFALPMTEGVALKAILQVCRGLDAAHAKGLIHCDLKPENVIIRRAPGGRIDDMSQCVLIDFSYRSQSAARALNEVTLQYVAPEMLDGQSPDRRTDLYAIGVMLYRLLSGSFPFDGASLPEIMRRQRTREFASLGTLRSELAPGLCKAVARLLEPNPANRPENVQALVALLDEFTEARPAGAPVTSGHVGFVGREAEIEECLVALDFERPSAGISSIEVYGARGVGVTAFLRELQDRLEVRGVTVLTATPRAVGGTALQAQLRDAVHMLARRPNPASIGTERLASPDTSTDLLDDLFVAAQERRVALFIDDWRLCDVGETIFLQRLVLQDRAAIDGMARRSGRCQVILGDTWGEVGREAGEPLAAGAAKRVRLDGLTLYETADLLSSNATLSRLHAPRVHASTRGYPKAIHSILDRVVSGSPERSDDALDVAIAAAAADAGSTDKERELAALRATPHGDALLALVLWGEPLAVDRWRALLARFGGPTEEPAVDRVDRHGEAFVRSRHRHLAEHMAHALNEPELAHLADATMAVVSDDWRSHDPEGLLRLLRVAARLGGVPLRYRWRVCRALIVLLERGRFADLESVATALARRKNAPWWVGLFREAARAGSGGLRQTLPGDIDAPNNHPADFFRSWIRARGLMRARYPKEALQILERLSAVQLPWAQCVALALSEDHALAAGEAGCVDKVRGLRRQVLHRIRRWLPVMRRRRRDRDHLPLQVRLRACRKCARYQRVRCRVHVLNGHMGRALVACRRERILDRADGNLMREAACLNNEGVLLIKARKDTAPTAVLERCVQLREQLDDEHGLVIALNNLAAAFSLTGNLGSAAAVLNRARIIATRNGLSRQRNMALVNLGVAYHHRGQLRDAQRIFRQARRLGRDEGDADAYAQALFNGASVALDAWNPVGAEGHVTRLGRLADMSAERSRRMCGDLVRAELAYRSRDWAHLHTLIARVRGQGVESSQTAVYEARVAAEAGNGVARRQMTVEHECSAGSRLRLMLLRWCRKRISLSSVGRVVAYARRHALAREAVEWMLAYLGQQAGISDAAVDQGLSALSWFEFREGHDDLQIELRARLAAILRGRGRHAEAWRLIEDTLLRFRTLERRLRRWPRGVHLLLHLQERLQVALTGSAAGRGTAGQEISAALCVQAFDVLIENRRKSLGAHDQHAAALLRLGTALGRSGDGGAFIDEVLSVALGVTGAQRAILITGTSAAHEVRRIRLATGGEPGGSVDISWAIVSQVLTSGEASLFSDALTAEELASHRSIAVLKLRSLACVPLRAGGKVLGALYLDHHGIAGLINQDLIGFLELLSGLIATTLHVGQVEEQAGVARRELAETYRHIMRAERNRLAGEIAAGLVHDLKNVLAAVSGRAQLLRRANQDPQVLRSLDAIERAAGTGVGLVQRLQECARDHSSQSEEEVNLAGVAAEALELLSPRLDKNAIKVDLHGAPDALVWGVPGEYREMFLNLFVNACDAMPEGGMLSVQVALDPQARQVELKVCDTGIGMSTEIKGRIFEPFYTTKGNKGTGLGLVVVRSVVVRHGGSISVESGPGAGTSFYIVLPCTSAQRPG